MGTKEEGDKMKINGTFIKLLRDEKNLSLRELSVVSGVSKSQISDLENGQLANTTVETICKLATALDINPAALFTC